MIGRDMSGASLAEKPPCKATSSVCLMFAFLLRWVLQKDVLAALAIVAFFATPALIRGDFVAAFVIAAWVGMGLTLLLQFGVLSVVVAWISWQILSWPISLGSDSPQIDVGLLGYTLVVVVACLGIYVATARPRRRLAETG